MLYGFLVDSIFNVASQDLVLLVADSTDQTLTAETGLDAGAGELGTDAEEFLMVQIPTAVTSATEIHGYAFPNGILFATNIQFMANDTNGDDMTTNDVRVHGVYRSAATARV